MIPGYSRSPMYYATIEKREADRENEIKEQEQEDYERKTADRFLAALERSNKVAERQSLAPTNITINLNVSVASDEDVQRTKDTLTNFVNSLNKND